MSTRSLIVTKTDDDKYRGIYAHWDGYPEHNGRILQEHYTDQEKIDTLIDLGNVSVLAPSTEKPTGHSYDAQVEGHCVFYGRDRGEEEQEAFEESSIQDILNLDYGQDFVYIWNGSKWTVYFHQNGIGPQSPTEGKDLREVLESASVDK